MVLRPAAGRSLAWKQEGNTESRTPGGTGGGVTLPDVSPASRRLYQDSFISMRFDNNVQNSLPRCRRPRSLFFPGLVHGLSPPSRGPVGLSVRIRDPPLSPDRNSTEFRGKALTVHVTNGFAGTFKVKQPGRQEWQRCAEPRPARPDAQGWRPPAGHSDQIPASKRSRHVDVERGTEPQQPGSMRVRG